ncbi:cytochrome c3 family protein [Rubinisphaera margarita]|uniref:cytochrome c3 family protein n=1 Tax=Rubinisphaera margarita TaxID=2909586 RepID=UPI001EE96C89|nr:cytochrome c3 family protein [Rubinisphaera margarita]MCG6157198.1 cytochrome c family protein [Rubinisphaera margarita]
MSRFHFPAWINPLLPAVVGFLGIGALYYTGLFAYAVHPATSDVGYRPEQPVPFSHALHAGRLKMDCRYCHNTVEVAAHAAIPPVGTCLNCHQGVDQNGQSPTVAIHVNSLKLQPIRESAATGQSVVWRKVHDLPDYAYFNHSAHVTRGVSCVSCHGRVDRMEVVEQKATLAMGFCLKCHRNPTPSLRPVDEVTNLAWEPGPGQENIGQEVAESLRIHPQENCSTCHR